MPIRQGKIYGALGPFETVARDEAFAENKTGTFTVVGEWDLLAGKNLKPGDKLNRIPSIEDPSGEWYVRTVTLSREEGAMARMVVQAVRAFKSSDGKPYVITYQVSMDAVEKKLQSHPKLKDVLSIIMKWDDTPSGIKYGEDGKSFYYVDSTSVTGQVVVPIKIKDEWAKKYCQAVMHGITTYNEYYPVITKTTNYLEVPGATYDSQLHYVTGGTIDLSTENGQIGRFCDPPINVNIGAKFKEGKWLKSMDTLTGNADGTSSRTEQWTFAPKTGDKDYDPSWIYEE